jgi:hypothetical protein
MTELKVSTEELLQTYLGLAGKGLFSMIVRKEVPPSCDLLRSQNKLVISPGALSGTSEFQMAVNRPAKPAHRRHQGMIAFSAIRGIILSFFIKPLKLAAWAAVEKAT